MGQRRKPVATDRRLRSTRFSSDYGPAERWQHSGRVFELTERAGIMAARALEEHVLDFLVMRRWISSVQREAALRFKSDYHAAGLAERIIGSYNPARTSLSPFGSWDERSDAEEAAYQRWRHAVRAMGLIFNDIVITVVCHDKMPAPQQMTRIKTGLEKLVEWYQLSNGKNQSSEAVLAATSDANVDQASAR